MSRTHRRATHWKYPHRNPKTFNEIKANSDDYSDSEYRVSIRKRSIPTAWDDQVISAYFEQDYNK